MRKDEIVFSDHAPEPIGAYPHAKFAGNLLFLSGVGPRKRGSNEIPGVTLNDKGEVVSYDLETQCHAVFENVKLILEASGAKWEDLVDVTVFLTNMKKDFPVFNKIYYEYFKTNQPCRTTVEVNALPTPIAIELKCVAIVPSKIS
jgi:2-aminomuconate deaminase